MRHSRGKGRTVQKRASRRSASTATTSPSTQLAALSSNRQAPSRTFNNGAVYESSRRSISTQQRKTGVSAVASKRSLAPSSSPVTTSTRSVMNVFDSKSPQEMEGYSSAGDSVYAMNTISGNFITLNRPKQLNALTTDMIRSISPILRKTESTPGHLSVVVSGHGDRAFCAGGDIMALYTNGKDFLEKGDERAYARVRNFFREEYQLNYQISRMITPYIAFMNGITMGGGVGLAMHGLHRIATEKTLFAMPETGIGFFPDVGASHLLPRIENNVGMYLALTGARLKGADLVRVGLASQFAFSHDYGQLFSMLADGHQSMSHVTRSVNSIAVNTDDLPLLSLTPHLKTIERCFGKGSVSEIMEALREELDDKDFAQKTLRTLETVSPLSLRVTFEQMERGKTMDLDECLTMEYDIALNMIHNPDFYTGVKSMLIDRSRNKRPDWIHDGIQEVDDSDVYQFFETPVGEHKLDVLAHPVHRGMGWGSIERREFIEDDDPRHNPRHYQYPMFHPIPQQMFPPELTAVQGFGVTRDTFHLMYWNYLLKHVWTRFPLEEDPAIGEEYLLSAHAARARHKELSEMNTDITMDDIMAFQNDGQASMTEMGRQIMEAPSRLFKARQQLERAKQLLRVSPHPEEREHLTKFIDSLTPKGDDAELFGSLNDAIHDLSLTHPKASYVIAKIKENIPQLPLFHDNMGGSSPENDAKATYFVTHLLFNYPPEEVISIRKDIREYYTAICELLRLPRESAPALMLSEVGHKNFEGLGCFGDDWQKDLESKDNEYKTPAGDLFSLMLQRIEKSSFEDIRTDLLRLGISIDPEVVFPHDKEKQAAWATYLQARAEKIKQQIEESKDAFQPEVLARRLETTLSDEARDKKLDEFTIRKRYNDYVQLDLNTRYEDDVDVKGMFSDHEIDLGDDSRRLYTFAERLAAKNALEGKAAPSATTEDGDATSSENEGGRIKPSNPNGLNYHGESLDALTVDSNKLVLSDEEISILDKDGVKVSATAVNTRANNELLRAIMEERVRLPFDAPVNDNKVIAYAERIALENAGLYRSPEAIEKRKSELIQDALSATVDIDEISPTRIIDTGEILPGEIIPSKIQQFMKPYRAEPFTLPDPAVFHTSVTLAKITDALQKQGVVRPDDIGRAIASYTSYDHLDAVEKYKGKSIEYELASDYSIRKQLEEAGSIIRSPDELSEPSSRPFSIFDPDPNTHAALSPNSTASPMMPLSKEERLARQFLQFIRVPDYAIDSIYPTFNYFLDDPHRHPGRDGQLNFDGANPYGDHPDAFKINYSDISRPMLPPKFSQALREQLQFYKDEDAAKGIVKL